jgi:hypothetical protein
MKSEDIDAARCEILREFSRRRVLRYLGNPAKLLFLFLYFVPRLIRRIYAKCTKTGEWEEGLE